MIIGGDVVQVAIAQLCAGPIPFLTPVVFSFGWVTYVVSAMLSAVGDNRLMPSPEVDCCVINAKNGYNRSNYSWILSRILRDFEHWRHLDCDQVEQQKLSDLRAAASKEGRDPTQVRIGLRVTVWQCLDASGKASGDLIYWAGLIVAVVQLGIAAIPWGLYEEWLIFFVVAAGTVLAFASGALPQWTKEKFGVRRLKNAEEKKDVFLTRGNGDHDALLILGCEDGMDLEALASPYRDLEGYTWTRSLSLVLAALWILLLITIAGYHQHTWFIMAPGMLGILHNIAVAGAPRQPKAFGIDLTYEETIVDAKVMSVLWTVEERYPKAGAALIAEFFPGDVFPREKLLFEYAERRYKAHKAAKKVYKKALEQGMPAESPKLWRMPPLSREKKLKDDNSDIPLDGEYHGVESGAAQQQGSQREQTGAGASRDHVVLMS